MTLDLDVNEINFILQTLGELPSKSGVWPLIVKVKEQAEAQVPKPNEASTQTDTVVPESQQLAGNHNAVEDCLLPTG